MSAAVPQILSPGDGPPAEVTNRGGRAAVCLVCEHASAMIPAALGDLGLAPEHRRSHAVWDIGALDVARELSARLDAPLVASRVSRLVFDCNRPPEAPDSIPERVETIDVPGNRGLATDERAARVSEIYLPFRQLLSDTLDAFAEPPVLVTIHSFTPTWFGVPRDVELGLLHDEDDRLARRMLKFAPDGIRTALNEPYSAADGVTHTLREHALPRGLLNVMIEIRNDLLDDSGGAGRFAELLAGTLTEALAQETAS